ncbi:MAG TPA: outer membrane protein assembly factor BamD, partial [Bryobacteraceae bacterium]
QMEKSDRDWTQTLRAEDECRQLLVQFPNSKFAPQATQRLRNIQESLAEHEFVVGDFYFQRGANPAAANRLNALVDQYPLYSKADEALYEAGESYSRMGPRFRQKAADMYDRIVSEYPLSARVADAKRDLADMEMPIPKVDEAALRRAKFEEENYRKPGMLFRYTEWMRGSPDVTHAAREGSPTMTDPKRTLPASIPVVNNNSEAEVAGNGTGTGTTDVTASQVGSGGALDANADARTSKPSTDSQASPSAQTAPQQPLPTNRDEELKKMRAKQAKKQAQLAKKYKKKHGAAPSEPASTATQAPAGAAASAPDATASSPAPTNPAHTAPQS